jgi:Tol biopolymer transport system component
MKTKREAKVTIADAVYEAVHDLEDATDKKLNRAIKALPNRL